MFSPPVFSFEKMLEISQSISLSQRQTKILATGVRSIVGKSRVEPNIEQKMSEAAHRLDKHFVSTPLELEVKEEGVSVVKIVPFFHVPCVEDFVNDLMASRKLDPHKQDVKIGMDDGQGKLKICLSIVDKQCLKVNDQIINKINYYCQILQPPF